MKQSFKLAALAFATTVLMAACGGGGVPGDTAPPSVTIASAAGDGGTVSFTFTFSESVGTTFTAEDVVVTGGTAGATVTKLDATHYTLSVFPTNRTVSVTLADHKFADLNSNVNVASTSHTYTDTSNTVPAGFNLIWSDEFTNAGLPDGSKWAYDTGRNKVGWFNNEKQYYGNARLQNSSITNGVLSVTAVKESLTTAADYGNQAYTSARLITQGKFSFKYGFVEVRAKLPCGLGTWPAIWTLGIPADNWPVNGEMDIMEQRGTSTSDKATVLGTLHMPSNFAGNGISQSKSLPDACTAFHKYQLNWSATQIQIGVDGVVYNTYDKPAGATANNWPFDVQQFIILNLAMGGDLGGPIPSNFTTDSMQVDYVRVYQK